MWFALKSGITNGEKTKERMSEGEKGKFKE